MPTHEDDKASLSVSAGRDGKVLLKCHAGCKTEDIVRAAGLTMESLFPESSKEKKTKVAIYDYVDAEGRLVYQTVRQYPKDFRQRRPDGMGGWIWNLQGITPVLYRLPEVIRADQVVVVEGEKDADSVNSIGITATTSPMGAGKWRAHYNEYFRGKHVAVLPDNDESGRKHGQTIAENLLGIASSLKVTDLPGLKPKGDVSDWLQNGGSKEKLLALLGATPQFSLPAEQGEQAEDRDLIIAVSFRDVVRREFEDKPIIDGLPDEKESLIIVGQSGLGKSSCALNIASRLAIASAQDSPIHLFDQFGVSETCA